MKSLFILLLLPLLLLLHSSFFLLPHNPQAPSLPPHPWQSHKTPSISCILASHHFTIPAQPQPHPIPCHAMPCHAPRKKKETVLPPGPFYTVDRVTDLPPNMKPATKYGEEIKKPQPSESLVCILMGGWWRRHLRWHFFLFSFYDRQDWRRCLHTREVPLYLCTWEVRYFEKSLPWEVLDPRLLSHIDTLLFFESRKGTLLLR